MESFEIDGNMYRVTRLDTFKQFHVARRLAPMYKSFMEVVASLKKSKEGLPLEELIGQISPLELVGPLSVSLAEMTDADADFVLYTCLNVVSREQGGAWRPVKPQNGNRMLYDDITMPAMLEMVGRVIMENLGGFFPQSTAPASRAST